MHLAFSDANKASRGYFLAQALENKLFAAWHFQFEFKKSIATCNDPIYSAPNIKAYRGEQLVLCYLDSYLNAIYSSLEIVANINKLFYPVYPKGFRDQA